MNAHTRAAVLLPVLLLCTARLSSAQQKPNPPLPDAPSSALPQQAGTPSRGQEKEPAQPPRPGESEADREVRQEEQQRIAGIVPNFNTVLSGQGVKLNKRQKTELALRATFDPFNAVGAVVLAGLSEVTDTHRGYGWGPAGYFKRVGANGLDVIDGTMLAGAVYPILLHQDPRFFRQGVGTFPSRLRHALVSPFVCKGDNQRPQPNYSNVLGNFTAGAISNLYYPAEERGFGLAAEGSAIVTIEGSLGNIGLEFSPDVADWWKRRRRSRVTP